MACVNLNITRDTTCYAASADPIQAKVDECVYRTTEVRP
jgi:hypothetical protein